MTRTILLADDSVTIQKVIELTFMDDDYRVIAASNGDEALAKLDNGRPHIVIADVHMPGANGYAVARRAKERFPGVPVLLLVGTFEPFDEAEARACGADGHIKKPFDSQELQRRVEELITPGAAPAAESPLESTLPPPPEPFEIAMEEPPRRAGFDFQLESLLVAPVVTPPVEEAAHAAFTVDEPELPVVELEPEFEIEEPEPMTFAAPVSAPEPAPEAPAAKPAVEAAAPNSAALSDDDVDRIARRVIDLLGDKPVRDIAWEVVPDLAEMVIRERLQQLEAQVD